jgi:ABC-type multidrug transport system ATPase subunit
MTFVLWACVRAFAQYYLDALTDERMRVMIQKAQRIPGLVEEPVTISFRNLFYKKDGVMRLQGVSGYIKPRSLVCVLGAEDSGITSLLQVLSGRQNGGFVTGELLINGSPPDETLKRRVGFIPKDDIAFPTLTVQETLEFSARLRLPPNIPDPVRRIRARTTMHLLGLRHRAHTIVGSNTIRGISGGEKR